MRHSWVSCLAGALCGAIACSTEPAPPPSLANIVTGTVTDSLGDGLRGIWVDAVVWLGSDSAAQGGTLTEGTGEFEVSWQTPVPFIYDSLTLVTDHGSRGLTSTVCRPYSSERIARTAAQLTGLPNDSVHIPIQLGLGAASPALTPGVSCAIGFTAFEEWTSDFLFLLTIESLGATPQDSLRGQWHIVFRKSSGDMEGSFAGVVTGDTLDLALGMAPNNYAECAPGYRLRIALDETQRLGDGFLETLNPTVPLCPVDPLDPLRFVPSE